MKNKDVNRKEVPINASRLVNAISRIGYKPSAALMDIIDNSVMANATNITIEFVIEPDVQINKKNNVQTYRIIDDGNGMDEAALLNSLTLGSDDNYGDNSLSKYGLGLKSAGFSLGNKICILTKESTADLPICAFVDKEQIFKDDGYYVYQPDINDNLINQELLAGDVHGTVVEVQDTHIPHEAALTTINKLAEILGVTFSGFLEKTDNPLNITIKYFDKIINVKPHDMLFKKDAKTNYLADDYDYESNYLTHKEYSIELEDAPNAKPIKVNIALFPRAQMSGYGGFTKEQKDRVSSYKVTNPNKGFYVYRNGRLIRWGDLLPDGKGGNLVGRDNINLRASIEFESEHDNALHVDVSKQRFDLPSQVSDALKEILTFPKEYSKEILALCTKKYQEYKYPEEGVSFNVQNSELTEEDSLEAIETVDIIKTKKRKKELFDNSEKLKKAIESTDESQDKSSEDDVVIPRKVRYSEKINSQHLWEVGLDAEYGTYVVINKNHPYYLSVFHNLNETSPERQSLEALFWTFAVAENIVRTKVDGDEAVIKDVIERFKMEVGYNISHWVRSNIDLFG